MLDLDRLVAGAAQRIAPNQIMRSGRSAEEAGEALTRSWIVKAFRIEDSVPVHAPSPLLCIFTHQVLRRIA